MRVTATLSPVREELSTFSEKVSNTLQGGEAIAERLVAEAPDVGRSLVSALDLHDVSHHQLGGVDLLRLPVPQDLRGEENGHRASPELWVGSCLRSSP